MRTMTTIVSMNSQRTHENVYKYILSRRALFKLRETVNKRETEYMRVHEIF